MTQEELLVKIKADTSELSRGISDAQKKIGLFSKASGVAGKALTGIGKVGLAVGKTVAAGAAAAGASLVVMGKQALNAYSDYEQLSGGVKKLFGDIDANAVLANADQAFKTAGMSANQYMETVTSFSASLIKSLNGDTTKAAAQADKAIRDMSDNANTFGTDISSLQTAYAGFAKGNFTMLDNLKLGYGGTKEEMEKLLADAKDISGIEYNIDNYSDIVDAINIIQEKQGIMGTTALEASKTVEGSINMMKGAWQNWIAGLGNPDADLSNLTSELVNSVMTVGDNVIPVVKRIGSSLMKEMPNIINKVGGVISTGIPVVIGAIEKLLPLLPPVVKKIGSALLRALPPIVSKVLDYAKKRVPEVIDKVKTFVTEKVNGLFGNLEIFDSLKESFNYLKESFAPLKEAFTPIFEAFTLLGEKASSAEGKATMLTIAGGALTLIFKTLGLAIRLVAKHIKLIVSGTKTLISGFTALLSSIKNVVNNGINKFNDLKTKTTNAVNAIKNTVKSKFDSIKTILPNAIESAKNSAISKLNSLKSKFSSIITSIKNLFSFSVKTPHIPLPHFTISPSGWKVGDLLKGSIPSLGVSWYAKGGIFDSASLIGVGEKGREAVLPLDRNTGWIDELAAKLNSNSSGSDKDLYLTLNVGGTQFGKACIKSINQAQRQAGAILLEF